MKHYKAPWSKMLIGMSAGLTILCVGIGVILPPRTAGGVAWLAWFPILLTAGCALFMIRGYTITPDAIRVHRLFWTTKLPRGGLESAQVVPNAMQGSLRTFGNGGFFSFTGHYWSKALGAYRAFVTDPALTVVLRYVSGRTVLLSPAAPEEFVQDLGMTLLDRKCL